MTRASNRGCLGFEGTKIDDTASSSEIPAKELSNLVILRGLLRTADEDEVEEVVLDPDVVEVDCAAGGHFHDVPSYSIAAGD
jgi:hypothetical protein